ncbi:hypothetical protein [Vibrio parahaemolyticus]|uniref:hypothetical protein n=1 Tax=Vibrio parahaemolyticus TaxID=670 RepID=UPI00215C808D|nr:hypothetical protein [Vibrio parahaemolyticus]MCR9645927.1 hypothetical protein [Vibrio parahaemolyticus]MCR9799788.1 hypothetical protein [Vibrio parahaemolyticus]MDF4316106.1 hypothetical protein [Vibrio parahaemolyticus]MDT8848292.1 hypothetical protein [Vibrio parahaemolyticus]MDT8920656.1 hypothetical protein [Vibrio parahaemolyticus]
MTEGVRELLLAKGWGRHSCILIDASVTEWLAPQLPESVRELCVDGNLLIISLYDCAVINPCFLSEPWVNVLIAKKIDSLNKQFQNGRNERRLHFSISADGQAEAFEVNASSIIQFEREKLLELEKHESYQVEEDSSQSLKHWMAERFRRDVWPDAFNRSIKSAERRLKRFYERRNAHLSGVYLKLDSWDEKPEGEKYEVCGIVVIEDNCLRMLRRAIKQNQPALADASNEEVDNALLNEFIVALDETVDWTEDRTTTSGVALVLKTESQVTLAHQRQFRRLNPYTLSDQNPEAPMPAEMESST